MLLHCHSWFTLMFLKLFGHGNNFLHNVSWFALSLFIKALVHFCPELRDFFSNFSLYFFNNGIQKLIFFLNSLLNSWNTFKEFTSQIFYLFFVRLKRLFFSEISKVFRRCFPWHCIVNLVELILKLGFHRLKHLLNFMDLSFVIENGLNFLPCGPWAKS